jgi:mono/diheme cytochrome c family protein
MPVFLPCALPWAPRAQNTIKSDSMKPTALLGLLCSLFILLLSFGVGAEEVKTDLYTVVDGVKVDAKTMTGFRTWRAAACDRCHGANQEGLVGPSLVESLKKLTKEEFQLTVKEGRLEKGMPAFKESEQVVKNMDQLYSYLKGRSNGDIIKAKVQSLE